MNDEMVKKTSSPVRTKPLPQEWCGVHYMDEREVDAAARVLRARSPFRYYGLNLQNEVKNLESEFASYCGAKYAVAVSSGTAALQVALGALGVGPGDEVILPGYFWVATIGAVVRSGAIPVLVDTDNTFSTDPDKVEEKITPRTKAIITVHMGGVIGRIKELVALAKKHNIPVLEDCAQASGAWQNGIHAGTFGDIGIFSFQLNKHMTSGEGGMIITNNELLYKRSFAIHDLGYPRNANGRLEFSDPSTQLWGIGCRMSEITGAVARVQLSKLNTICGNMRKAKNKIKRAVSGIKGIMPRTVIDPEGDAGSFLMLTFETRDISLRVLEALRAEGLVGANGGMNPIHMENWGLHIYYNIPSLVNKRGLSAKSVWDLEENSKSEVSYGKGTCPCLDSAVERTLILCVPSILSDDDTSEIITAIQKVAKELL